MYVMTKILHSC